jgi:hypothetical protein
MIPAELPALWRARAETLRRFAPAAATAFEDAADELEAALREAAETPLTLAEAARESGYSERRLRELLAAGAIPNAGRKNAPRIRRADLPRKASRAVQRGYDPRGDAARLLLRAS